MSNNKKIEKETIKEVLTSSTFEYNSNINNKLINEKGKTNISFGMRCFIWLVATSIFILFLNIIGIDLRVKNAARGIAVETQSELKKYEHDLNERLIEESEKFKDIELIEELENNPIKVLSILLNVQSESGCAFYIKANGETTAIDVNGNIKINEDTETYNRLQAMLKSNEKVFTNEKWYYERSVKNYRKLHAYKIYNADGSLNGMIAYTNATSKPITMLTNIHLNVAEMKFFIFDEEKRLIYTNNENASTIEAMSNKINQVKNKNSSLVWDNTGTEEKPDIDDEQQLKKTRKNNNTGLLIAQIAKNVGNGLKTDSIIWTVNNYYEETGYTIFIDYRRTISTVIRNLVFFYLVVIVIVLAVLYVMTYFYKYTKNHANLMFKTVSVGIISAIILSIAIQTVSYLISSSNMARVEGTILGDAIFTNVKEEQYLEYIALINHIDLNTELETKKNILNKEFANYYVRFGLEYIEPTIITKESYLSERAKRQIEENGVYVKTKKSGGERYIEIETIKRGLIRNKDVWFKLNAHIETKVSSIFEPMITNFGEYDSFEIMVEEKSFKLDTGTKYYKQSDNPVWTSSGEFSNEKIETSRNFIETKTKLNLDGYSYIIAYKNYDAAFIILLVAIAMIVYIGMYFDIVFSIKNMPDEDVQDNRYKHLIAEWLSGNITVIDEGNKDKQSEYDELLLERLRKTNIDRIKLTKKETTSLDNFFEDEDETYARIKKEKDVFGISLFSHRKNKMVDTSIRPEIFDENPQGTITELKDSVVSTIQSEQSDNQGFIDAEKLKVTEERLAIQKVLDEMEDKKNSKGDETPLFVNEDDISTFDSIELTSKDEKLDEKIDKKNNFIEREHNDW